MKKNRDKSGALRVACGAMDKKYADYANLTECGKNEMVVKDNIGIENYNDLITFKRTQSNASCKLSEIRGFTFGGFSSRFWTLRKHINSMSNIELRKSIPFHCWECITIQTLHRDIDLVIPN